MYPTGSIASVQKLEIGIIEVLCSGGCRVF
jgi:hypothetical protein